MLFCASLLYFLSLLKQLTSSVARVPVYKIRSTAKQQIHMKRTWWNTTENKKKTRKIICIQAGATGEDSKKSSLNGTKTERPTLLDNGNGTWALGKKKIDVRTMQQKQQSVAGVFGWRWTKGRIELFWLSLLEEANCMQFNNTWRKPEVVDMDGRRNYLG